LHRASKNFETPLIVKLNYEYEKLKEHITGLSPELILDFAIKVTKEIDALKD
jgi:hypothetical protein